MELTKEEAVKLLSDKVAEFEKALTEAEEIADKYGLGFNIYPTFGMGGLYQDGGWEASSEGC